MDKYQELLLSKSKLTLCTNQTDLQDIVIADDAIRLAQNKDITIADYVFSIESISIENIIATRGSDSFAFAVDEEKRFTLKIDFEKPIDCIQISFKHGIADSITLPMIYVCASKEEYYKTKAEEQRCAYQKVAKIQCVSGADLINVYFQPCCEEYDHSEVALYRDMLLGIFPVEKNCFYKSLTGLAYGTYGIKVKQFKKDGTVIFESELLSVSIDPPEKPSAPSSFGRRKLTVIG